MNSDKNNNEKYENYKKYISELKDGYVITFEKIEFYINQSSKLNSTEKKKLLFTNFRYLFIWSAAEKISK